MPTKISVSRRTVALVALLAILPYLNSLATDFTLDDGPTIRDNPAVTRGVDLVGILAAPLPPMENLYRPLTVLTYALNEKFTPGYAPTFHAVNVFLHAGVTILVFWMGVRLFQSAQVAAIAATLFAIHPIHTEAVTSIVGRAELLVALFGLIAVLTAARIDEATSVRSRWTFEVLSVTSYALALLSKESAVTLLPLILLFRIVCRNETLRAGLTKELRTLTWVPYVLCTAVFVVTRYHVVGVVALGNNLAPLDNALGVVPWDVRVRTAVGVMWDYFALLNVPLMLSADYSYHQVPLVTSWMDPRFLAGSALLLIAAAALLRRNLSSLGFAVIFPFIALSVTANIFFPIGTIKAERLLYLPSVGWGLLVAYGVDWLLRVRRYQAAATTVLVLMVAGFGARTWMRNWDWKDNPTLFESMARSAPDSAKAHYNFGVALQHRGANAAAEAEFRRALSIMSKTEGAAFGIATELNLRGSIEQAAAWYRRALEIDPGYDLAHHNLCRLFLTSDQFAAATAACRNGLRYQPRDADLLKGLGASLVGLGETERGVEVLRRSLLLNQEDHELRMYVARLDMTATTNNRRAVTVQ